MKHTFGDSGITWEETLSTGDDAQIQFRDIRRERTGVHAWVGLFMNKGLLAYDIFNVLRSEERRKLSLTSQKQLGDVRRLAWPLEEMQHALDICSLETIRLWEEERIQVVEYTDWEDPGKTEFILKPFIVLGGGTFLYAPPGSGKSYLLQSMAIAIGAGHTRIWDVQATTDVLYINLERDGTSMKRRDLALRRALDITAKTNVWYLHARGLPLSSLRRQAKKWVTERKGKGVIMLDSISRSTEGGSLNDDTTANGMVDMLNALGALAWIAIGHSPAANQDKLYGSIHFQAGCDVEVKVTSESKDNVVGLCLQIDKANDIGKGGPVYLALEFPDEESPISAIRRARKDEFPELATKIGMSKLDRIFAAIDISPDKKLTREEIAKTSGLDAAQVSRLVSANMSQFVEFAWIKGRGRPLGRVAQIDTN